MATANVVNIKRIQGRLCYGPTDLTTAFPHGGTAIGLARDIEFRRGYKGELITAVEWGNVPADAIYGGEIAVFAAVLREFDNSALSAIFPNTATGTSSGDTVVNNQVNSGNRAGYALQAKAIKLLFSPTASLRDPAILLYNAIPIPEEAAAIKLSLGEEVGRAIVFYATPDSNGKVSQECKLEDMSLT